MLPARSCGSAGRRGRRQDLSCTDSSRELADRGCQSEILKLEYTRLNSWAVEDIPGAGLCGGDHRTPPVPSRPRSTPTAATPTWAPAATPHGRCLRCTMTVRLHALATVLPPTTISQSHAADLFARQPSMSRLGSRLVRSVFAGAQVRTRRTVLHELGDAAPGAPRDDAASPD